MTKSIHLLFAVLALAVATSVARAEIRITVSRFDNNQLKIEGHTAPNRAVTIDSKFKTQSDGGGYFEFKQTGYKPAGCMSDIRSGTDIYSAVIAGCFGEFRIEREKLKSPAPPR